MGTKGKKGKHSVSLALKEQVQRQLDKGQFKQALKQAKVCYRQTPNEQTHRLLERAYVGRARELSRLGLRNECRVVVQALLDLGATDPAVAQALPELLATTGLIDHARNGKRPVSLANNGAMLRAAADCAVLRPQEAPSSLPDIRYGAIQVRAALEAVTAGTDSPLAAVKDIPRNSPFADWKYFVRGLAAYYQGDTAEMRANWERLDPDRFAARIAQHLMALADHATASVPSSPISNVKLVQLLHKLEMVVWKKPVCTSLNELRRLVGKRAWERAIRAAPAMHQALQEIDPSWATRLVNILTHLIINTGDFSTVEKLLKVLPPPPLDPNWNRLRAMACTIIAGRPSLKSVRYWKRYLRDVGGLEGLPPEDRNLVQALVWYEIGMVCAVKSMAYSIPFEPRRTEARRWRRRAAGCFKKAIHLAPKLQKAYRMLGGLYYRSNRQGVAKACRLMLTQFPDDLDSLLCLAKYHLSRDEALLAQEYIARAQKLRPLDEKVRELAWQGHLRAARHYLFAGKWSEGRAELDAAEAVRPPTIERYRLLVHKAVFEMKAGDAAAGFQFLKEAFEDWGDSMPVLFQAVVDAIRYELPEPLKLQLETEWRDSAKNCRTNAAAQMAKTLVGYQNLEIIYPGWAQHVEFLNEYIVQHYQTDWTEEELEWICRFLDALSPRHAANRESFCCKELLLKALINKGYEAFSDSFYFCYMRGKTELKQAPRDCDFSLALQCCERAIELAKGSSSSRPVDEALVDDARQMVMFLRGLREIEKIFS